jgi:spore germination cell wall hydrolase CwlJ-like protein
MTKTCLLAHVWGSFIGHWLSKATTQHKGVIMTNELTKWSSRIMQALALLLVSAVLITVCKNHLDALRNQQTGMPDNYVTAAERTKQLECLTRNIYHEAASEPFEGKVGVAQVTLNRLESGRFANSVCGVVYQKNVFYERVVCQFSWYCENKSRVRPVNSPMWEESETVAKKVLLEGFRLPGLKHAIYYHADYVNPGWNKPRIEKIGRHIFYGERL